MILLVVLVLAVLVFGKGGYEPWTTWVLALGAAACGISIVFAASADSAEREKLLDEYRAWTRLPWTFRFPGWRRWLRSAVKGEVEYVTPDAVVPARHTVIFGVPFPRTGLGLPLGVLTFWIGMSIVPLERGALELLSPTAHTLRSEIEPFLGGNVSLAPTSLVPFLTLRGLWAWFGYLIFFYAGFRIARVGALRLTIALIALGAVVGGAGLLSSLAGWRHFIGATDPEAPLRAVAGFGNPNHYAVFLSMIFFCGLGAFASERRLEPRRQPAHDHERLTKTILIGSGLVLMALGILFSLSRSVIVFTTVTAVLFLMLARRRPESFGKAAVSVASLAGLALATWIGLGPVVERFERLPDRMESGMNRRQVVLDTLPAARDFWLTGSGLGSYRYITAQYRTFPGRSFYSWAHNDYLQLLVELGVPGLTLLVWVMVRFGSLARRARERLGPDPSASALHAGYLCAAVIIALHSGLDFGLHLPANLTLLAIVSGVVVGMTPKASTS